MSHQTPQRYKLLKDLPGYAAGAEFMCGIGGGNWTHVDESSVPAWMIELLRTYKTHPDWFELLSDTEKRWRAEYNNKYWYVGNDSIVYQDMENYDQLSGQRRDIGNYFRTREQAEAAAEAIKATLDYIHSPEVWNDDKRTELGNLLERAKRAVQKGRETV